MVRKTRGRKTHRSKSHKRRHTRKQTRRHTRKRGGACGSCAMRGQMGGRGGMGGAELGHAYESPVSYTTGASQELYQMTGRTPGLSSGGGSSGTKKRREARLAQEAAERNDIRMAAEMERQTRKKIANRYNKFGKTFVKGMPIMGYEGNEYKNKSRNEMKNKIREEALSEYVRMFENNEGFNELNLELNNNNNNNNNMGNVILPGYRTSRLSELRNKKRK